MLGYVSIRKFDDSEAGMDDRDTLTEGREVISYCSTNATEAGGISPSRRRIRLTEREVDVARRLVLGQSNKEIAADLGISPHTVRDHVSVLLQKADVPSRARLAAIVASAFLFGLDLLL
jgi:DNA-binding NarL/FixJ family response regulator